MKKIILSAIAIMTIGFANAQENSIKANPLSALFGGNDLVSFEHKIADKGTLALGLGYSSLTVGETTYADYGAELQYRFYFEDAFKGWYAGPNVGYSAGSVKSEYLSFYGNGGTKTYEDKRTKLQIGARAGYQWVFGSGFTLDLNLGLAYNKYTYNFGDTTNESLQSGYKASGILPNFGLGLGYTF